MIPKRERIGTEEYPILHRWVIFDFFWGRLAVHHIQPGVVYRDFHDHGHFMALFCFAGRYVDERLGGKRDGIRPGSFRWRSPPHPHKIEPGPKGAWTICFQGPVVRQEGFYIAGGWVPTDQYEASERWPWSNT